MTSLQHLWLVLLYFHLRLQGFRCFREVTLTIEPPAVEFGHHVTLGCHYDLEGAPLYSVKWYRGTHEFYRYSPNEVPTTKTFPTKEIHIDESISNETRVVLRNVNFNLAGNVTCEVTTESPGIKIKYATGYLQVTSIPRFPPEIHVDKDRYSAGEILNANCTSLPSKPPASLSFLINNQPYNTAETKHHLASNNLYWSSLDLSLTLYPSHFGDGHGFVLTCSAQVGSYYKKEAQIVISAKHGDPTHQRVMSHNCARWLQFLPPVWLTALVPLHSGLYSLT